MLHRAFGVSWIELRYVAQNIRCIQFFALKRGTQTMSQKFLIFTHRYSSQFLSINLSVMEKLENLFYSDHWRFESIPVIPSKSNDPWSSQPNPSLKDLNKGTRRRLVTTLVSLGSSADWLCSDVAVSGILYQQSLAHTSAFLAVIERRRFPFLVAHSSRSVATVLVSTSWKLIIDRTPYLRTRRTLSCRWNGSKTLQLRLVWVTSSLFGFFLSTRVSAAIL